MSMAMVKPPSLATLSDVIGQFNAEHEGRPARWFTSVGAAKEFIESLLRVRISYRSEVVQHKKEPFQIVVTFLGADTLDNSRWQKHSIPQDDMREHFVTRQCWCAPEFVEFFDEEDFTEGFWRHNCVDGREHHENHDGKLIRRLH